MPRQNYDSTPWGSNYGEELSEMEARIKNDLRAEYQAEKSRELFWNKLYNAAPDLRAHVEIVNAVFGESFNELSGWDLDSAVDEMVERARERIQYLKNTQHEREEAAVMVGGPGLEGISAADMPLRANRTSIGSAIKDRREARRTGQSRYNRERSTNG